MVIEGIQYAQPTGTVNMQIIHIYKIHYNCYEIKSILENIEDFKGHAVLTRTPVKATIVKTPELKSFKKEDNSSYQRIFADFQFENIPDPITFSIGLNVIVLKT